MSISRIESELLELSGTAERHLEFSKLHRRIAGLTTQVQRALRDKRETLDRLGALEERLAKQKRAIHQLEECREFEKETEELAERSLRLTADMVKLGLEKGRYLAGGPGVLKYLEISLADLAARKGPRP